MYARISHNFVPTQHNLRNAIPERSSERIFSKYSLVVKRQFSEWENIRKLKGKLEHFIEQVKMCKRILLSKSRPDETLKMWAQQFEFVFAHRLRRGQQMISLYSKWWEEKALKEFFRRLRISVNRNGREFIIGALGEY